MNVQNLKKEQLRLAKKVLVKDDFDKLEYVAGCDQTVFGERIISAVVVMELETLKVVEKKYAVEDAPVNYIPGFLSYRESPAVITAVAKLEQKPDVLLVNAHGILHPRRIGMASHLGILLDMPTIGVATKLLLGEVVDGKVLEDGDTLGRELTTKEHARPIYISPGHRVSLRTATDVAKRCMVEKHKLPEPLHEAHKYVKKVKRRLEEKEKEKGDS